ncbi:hypothetical protein [Actinomyces polynesiensis]|uniref:hypothetical protein n=1 Tax=Actinomyces polynesiensis TaxID=1325934 RepID=UPI0005BE62CE|nr:hypothetical protein [Actinomyces polynesiensis]
MFSANTPSGKNDKEPTTMGQRILGFCFTFFLSVMLLYLAVDILESIWGWLLLVAGIIGTIWVTLVVYRRWRDGW